MSPPASRLEVIPLQGIPLVTPGDDLAGFLVAAIRNANIELRDNDVLVVAQKVVSKAEGSVIELASVVPGEEAIRLAEVVKKDPKLVEVILSCTRRIVRAVPGVLITETHHGLICANAGVDASNSIAPDTLILLPRDPDESARSLRQRIYREIEVTPAVVISDTFNRPWRDGSMNVAIGTAGFVPVDDARGETDDIGRVLHATVVSIADEIASAAQLVMGETGGVPAALVRGIDVVKSNEGSASLLRDPERDLFR